jgi:tetratricopeptide (TPR) repeat protein
MRVPLLLLLISGLSYAQFEPAEKGIAEGRYVDAAAFYTGLLKADPKNPTLLARLGQAQQLAGRDQEAVVNLQAALRKQANSVPALAALGAAYTALDQPQKAVPLLRKALASDPRNRTADAALGDALLALDRPAEALEIAQKWIAAEPEDPRAVFALARAFGAMATLSSKQLEKQKGGTPYLAILLAEDNVRSGDLAQAADLYRAAAAELPRMRGIHAGLAEIDAAKGSPAEADAETAEENELGPRDCDKDLAECDYAAGRFEKLIREPKSARTAEVQFWMTRAYRELSSQAAKRIAQLPASADRYRVRAIMLTEAESYGPAVAEWKQYLALRPQDGRARRQYAAALFDSGDFAAALPELLAQVEAAPQSPDWNYFTGEALYELHQYARAIPYLQKAGRDVKKELDHARAEAVKK